MYVFTFTPYLRVLFEFPFIRVIVSGNDSNRCNIVCGKTMNTLGVQDMLSFRFINQHYVEGVGESEWSSSCLGHFTK
jgi:hypothetical protein